VLIGDVDPGEIGVVDVRLGPSDFQAGELGQSLPMCPPRRIATVDDIGPGTEVDVFLDRDDAEATAKLA
jgi:hypothetical protein